MNPATAPKPSAPSRSKRVGAAPKATCGDCYFHQNHLCALDRKEPCPTFRPAGEGLKAPRQLSFVFRQERARSAWVFKSPD